MNMPGRPVDDRRDTLNIWFPLSIAAPVGVADFDTKRHTLAAILTFSQLSHLLPGFQNCVTNTNRTLYIMQAKKQKLIKTLQNTGNLYRLNIGGSGYDTRTQL